ncbi:MAG: hypothetical protein CL944_01650 [Candidatus Diapherotrites archaeon]|uniref:Uncharacterized protein n=1 Tax=Candidatus Iainarchaeum sp. TaxID=3101447 RepID=A0A2D6LPP5_9ARCH|nr:hypothetical protein [Candidatus Diapherotrites archaeon]|tara:strand:- start:15705 stop:16367 length:663 start_codon:yes stop_codon:yes gene_type:complete
MPAKKPEKILKTVPMKKTDTPSAKPRTNQSHVRLVKTSEGNRITVMPGVKNRDIPALIPGNWKNKQQYLQSGRYKKNHGTVFTATTADANGNKFRVRVRSIRGHYTTTHEIRMLAELRKLGFKTEQPLGIVQTPKKERFIVTRNIENAREGNMSDAREIWAKLVAAGIHPTDLYEYGKNNFLLVHEKGKKTVYLIDVEHYYALKRDSKLALGKMARKEKK